MSRYCKHILSSAAVIWFFMFFMFCMFCVFCPSEVDQGIRKMSFVLMQVA